VWADRRIGVAVVAGIAVLTGLLVALVMPRGPATAAHAVAFEQFEAFHQIMLDTILPETYGR
jgi:hypothetical protein